MFDELESVVLNHDFKEYNLKKGDLGTIVHVYKSGKVLEVEFIKADGKTITVLTLTPNDIRAIAKNEVLHVRDFSSAYPIQSS